MLGLDARVVDADALALDVLVDDGQERRLLPGQVHRPVDHVLVVVPERAGRRDARHAGPKVEVLLQVLGNVVRVFAAGGQFTAAVIRSRVALLGRGRGTGDRWSKAAAAGA